MAVMESQAMPKGTPLVPFRLKNFDGEQISSQDFSEKKLLLVVFTCNHCPYAKASWPILIDLQKRYEAHGLQITGVNPNNNPKYPDDRFEEMPQYVQENGINFPYLFDEDQGLAKLYGAVCTPDPFLFSSESGSFLLYYHGRINDNWQEPQKVTEKSMEIFIRAALKMEGALPEKTYPSLGCSIKWV